MASAYLGLQELLRKRRIGLQERANGRNNRGETKGGGATEQCRISRSGQGD